MSKVKVSLVVCRLAVVLVYNKLTGFLSRTAVPRKKTTITIEQGILKGLHYKTKVSNKPYVCFLGVPYAKPPVGVLRFKSPVKHPGWTGVLNAFTPGEMCMQYSFLTNTIIGSEDCLYLNIFVPQDELDEKKAVMIFIHGGAFNNGTGSPELYSPDYLIDENVIVVTINYRLNVLGFLNLDIEECPGNMGLKDQLFAIKWVKANISAFGGDAENITIFGESAGSASVHCHTLSPSSTGLFQKAIMQSGCIFNSWALNEKHKESAYNLARRLGCLKESPEDIIEYLLKLPASDIVKLTRIEGVTDFRNYEFIPSIELNSTVSDRFLPDHPDILAKSVSPIPVITGINNLEGMIAFGERTMRKLISTTEEINNLFENKYSEEVINKVKSFYFDEGNLECGTSILENNCCLYSDAFFSKDFYRGFNHLLYNTTPVYNYEFKFDGKINVCKRILSDLRPKLKSLKGACHADELSYLFFGQIIGYTPNANSPELRMCKTLSKLWTNFAKTGNPNSSDLGFEWIQTSLDKPKYLSIDGDDICMVDGILNSSRVQFWENISKIVQSEQNL